MKGPASRHAIDPAVLVAFVDQRTALVVGGHPSRIRRHINGVPIQDHDARIIRRWKSGQIQGVTHGAAARLLSRYMLDISDLPPNATLRGALTS